MSSLAAAQADGFYHPPEYDPRRHGGLSKFAGSKGSNQWEKHGVVRFELPYNCWCLGCNRAIGQGTRYNAKKVAAGKYFTTTIWEFQMKCATCPQRFVIRTDPKARDYSFVSGIRRIQSTPTAESAETTELASDETKRELASNAFFALEHREEDKRKARAEATRLSKLLHNSDIRRDDDYSANQRLRAAMRKRRRAAQELVTDGKRAGLPYALLPSSEADASGAAAAFARRRDNDKRSDPFRAQEKRRRLEIQSASIFAMASKNNAAPTLKSASQVRRARLLAADDTRRRRGIDAKNLELSTAKNTTTGAAAGTRRSAKRTARSKSASAKTGPKPLMNGVSLPNASELLKRVADEPVSFLGNALDRLRRKKARKQQRRQQVHSHGSSGASRRAPLLRGVDVSKSVVVGLETRARAMRGTQSESVEQVKS